MSSIPSLVPRSLHTNNDGDHVDQLVEAVRRL
jgi:hypothetical protein